LAELPEDALLLFEPGKLVKGGVTDERVLNRRLKMELGCRFKDPNFREGDSV
jgi:hypothetical protein